MKLTEAFVVYSFIRDSLLTRDNKPVGSFAYKFYKFMRLVDKEREIMKEVMDSQWEETYGITFEKADKETQEKMQIEFAQECDKIVIEVDTFITEKDVDSLGLSFDEIVKIGLLIEEK